jgi:hypothetical protein
MANSNNGDIIRVLLTVIQIVKDFTAVHSNAKIIFSGSTDGRMRLYIRILKMYGNEFRKEFTLTAFSIDGEAVNEVPFNPEDSSKYEAFFIKRIN